MQFFKTISSIALSLAVVAIIASGCDVNDSSVEGKGHLNVQLTDAPAVYDAVYIDIREVQIKSDNPDNNQDNNNMSADGWITINDNPVRVDLLKLRNGNTIQLGEEELDAGTYKQIRFVLGSDNEIVVNGNSHALSTPSAQQSGLKLNVNADIVDGETYNLLVDFDAAQSIVVTGNGSYKLKPVLHAVDLEETGSISGTVEPTDVQTSVMATANGDTLSTITDDNGQFRIVGAYDMTYDVTFEPSDDAYADTTVADVQVEGNEDVDMGTITLQ